MEATKNANGKITRLQKLMLKKPQWKFYLPSFGIFEREVRRFFHMPLQTIFAPLINTLIYFSLFGLALGKLLQASNNNFTHNFPYVIFLIPGLMAMETVSGSFQNPISSIMIARWTGNLVDVLMSPVSPLGLWFAYFCGALTRGLIVAFSVFIAGSLCAWQIVHINWFLLFFALVINVGVFASFGIIAGSLVKTFEQVAVVTSFILQPLSFFSGVFFSFNSFPYWMQVIKYFNPVFYIVSMFRFAVLGRADTSLFIAFSVSILFLTITFIFSLWFLKKGFGLRN